LGTAVGARILAKAGSLKKLASLPASTIQILGAEKALFRSLKTGTQPPKHGILFQHPIVHAAPKWQRGKMARAIASKAAIAARVDVYGGGLNQTLLEKLNVRVTEIGEKYKEPTQRPIPPQRMERRREEFRPRGGFKPRGPRREFRSETRKRKKFGKRR
jgi:nucleolar protein 56